MPLPAQPLFKLAEGHSSVIAARNGVPPSFGVTILQRIRSKKKNREWRQQNNGNVLILIPL